MNLVHTKSKITKKMKLYILFFSLLISTICSCSDKAYIQHFADIKYTGKDIPTPGFQIKGFYVNSAEWEGKKSDLKESVFIFYEDGIFAVTFLKGEVGTKVKDKPINLNDAVVKWGRKSQHWGSQYGLYKIEKDTINVTVYGRYEGHYDIYKYKFKILDADNILLCKYESPSLNPKESYSSQMHTKYKFIPADSIPIPDNDYLKKKIWFWENESDRERYMKSPGRV